MPLAAAKIPMYNSDSEVPVVYIVDDEPSVRESLQFFLGEIGLKTEGFESPHAFLDHYLPGTPGCLILDLRMPDMNGFDVLAQMRERGIELPVLILTAYATVPLTVRAMQAGAIEVFEKTHADQMLLLERIQHAFEVDRKRRRNRIQQLAARERIDRLTDRQRQVAARMVEGKLTKTIADELSLTAKTVEVHRKAVMVKTGAGSVAELVRIWDAAFSKTNDETN